MEAGNLFHGLVTDPYIQRYTAYYIRQASGKFDKHDKIIPDLHVANYPVHSATSRLDGHHTVIPAIIEVKGLRMTGRNYPMEGKAVEARASKIHEEYVSKAKWCDKKFAPEIVKDNPEAQGPFEKSLQHFYGGGPMGVVIGTMSEANKTVRDIIKTAAKAASITPEGILLSPELTSTGPHGSYAILKAQFTRLIGCTAARANAELKLRRKHYVRDTKAAAAQAAKQQQRNAPSTSDSRYTSADYTTNCQYHKYHQFRHAYRDYHNPNYDSHLSYDV